MASSSSSVSSSTAPVTFSGSSTYSSSFQQVLQRAVSIASLPIQQMQNNMNSFSSQQSALASLEATFGSLQNSLQSISSAVSGNVSASSSNGTIAVASAATNTLPGAYSLEVDDIGTSSSAMSALGSSPVTDPSSANISNSLSYDLTVNGSVSHILLTTSSMQSLATAINNAGAGVAATVVNLGSNASPDYRLSVTSSHLGADTIQLNDGTTNLLTSLHTGTPAQYKVNGNSTTLTSNSDQVTLAPGLTATMLSNSPGVVVNITVAANKNALTNNLSSFATAYNAAADAIAQHRGQNGGALAGNSVIYSLGSALSQISQFGTSSGGVQSLADLGLNLDATGHFTLDTTKISSASVSAIQQFLGTTTTGGFLQTANDALTGLSDPTTGALAGQITSLSEEMTTTNSQMADAQTRVDSLQTSLQAQLSKADAAIAVLEQQKTFYTDLFAAQYLTNNGLSGR